jgi:hypothetical protein
MGKSGDRLRDLEEFALVVVNNGNKCAHAEIPDRPDLFEWLCGEYQHQVDAFFSEIEELHVQVNSLKNQVKHDPRI